MLAVRVVEFTNAVEFTVTPPGLLVPLMNHCAVAPAWKPLPPTVTLRLAVPWVAEFGVALVTDICAATGLASRTRVMPRHSSNTAGRMVARIRFIFLTPFGNRAGPFALVTRTRSTVFRQARRNYCLVIPDNHKRGPIEWVPVPRIPMQHRPLRDGQRPRCGLLGQFAIKAAHQLGSGTVVHLPKGGDHVGRASGQKSPCQTNEFVTRGNFGKIPAAQGSFAGAEGYELRSQMKAENLVYLEPSVILRIRLQLYAGKKRIGLVEKTMGRKVNNVVLCGSTLEPRLGRAGANDGGPVASKCGSDSSCLPGRKPQVGDGWRERDEAFARRLRTRRHGQRCRRRQIRNDVIFDQESIAGGSRPNQSRERQIVEET